MAGPRKVKLGRKAARAKRPVPKSRAPTSVLTTPKRSKKAASQVRVGLTLRLNPKAYRQLKYLAVDENKKAHDILIEGVNLAFKKYKKPMIA